MCNFMGRWLAFLKCKQYIFFLMMECSSRNTVQFLTKIDHNHESQLRKSLEEILLINIWLLLMPLKKNTCNFTYAAYIFYI